MEHGRVGAGAARGGAPAGGARLIGVSADAYSKEGLGQQRWGIVQSLRTIAWEYWRVGFWPHRLGESVVTPPWGSSDGLVWLEIDDRVLVGMGTYAPHQIPCVERIVVQLEPGQWCPVYEEHHDAHGYDYTNGNHRGASMKYLEGPWWDRAEAAQRAFVERARAISWPDEERRSAVTREQAALASRWSG